MLLFIALTSSKSAISSLMVFISWVLVAVILVTSWNDVFSLEAEWKGVREIATEYWLREGTQQVYQEREQYDSEKTLNWSIPQFIDWFALPVELCYIIQSHWLIQLLKLKWFLAGRKSSRTRGSLARWVKMTLISWWGKTIKMRELKVERRLYMEVLL